MATLIRWAKQLWEWMKKLPGWAWAAALFVLAALYYYTTLMSQKKAVKTIRKKKGQLEEKKWTEVRAVKDEELEEIAAIEKKFTEEEELLDRRERELTTKVSSGPSGVASAWNDRLKRKKK